MTNVTFHTPSFSRFRQVFLNGEHGRISVLRHLEYERLANLNLSGRVLDYGGGSRTNYSKMIDGWTRPGTGFVYESVNIDPDTQPTFLIKPGDAIPVEAGVYDSVLALNTFEHIYDLAQTLDDVWRVLKPGGSLIIIVPFIFRVHGHPNDFSRHTPSYWTRKLNETGFGSVEIECLSWGPFSTGHVTSGSPGPLKGLRRNLSLMLDVMYFALREGQDRSKVVEQDHPLANTPLGYFIRATRS